MSGIELRYGINPRNMSARIKFSGEGAAFSVRQGDLGYINVLDAVTD
ncbi:hypothetical protein GCM10022223_32970 [Kineosporia mesophila]|uniref:Uncharacterized protein n=1 Tax=Kineosporia mesophila TaxID=566012 RepID=A0ABP6ZMM9_9ACTN|nr:hypothetical protein [Kineosporia mesophila]MCD5353707.1 hypothetical protein [Kineosporia mesophila]